jgi:pectate lyase
MRFAITTAMLLATVASATPTNLRNAMARRAATETCSIGYCTQNGGTTGGSAGSTVTVTSVDDLKSYAESDDTLTIIVSGALTGAEKIKVKDNKTIYGESGSCTSSPSPAE